MLETNGFRRLADKCLALADDPKISPQQRQSLIEMAMAWKQLSQNAAPAKAPAPVAHKERIMRP